MIFQWFIWAPNIWLAPISTVVGMVLIWLEFGLLTLVGIGFFITLLILNVMVGIQVGKIRFALYYKLIPICMPHSELQGSLFKETKKILFAMNIYYVLGYI